MSRLGGFEINVMAFDFFRVTVKQPIGFFCQLWEIFFLRGSDGEKFIPQHFTRPVNFARPLVGRAVANSGFFFGKKLTWMFVAQFFPDLFDFSYYSFIVVILLWL